MAGHGHIRAELHVFVGDDTAHVGAGLHHRVFKEHTVLHMSALFYPNAPEQNAVADAALNIAAIGDQGVDALAAGIDIGGGGVVSLAYTGRWAQNSSARISGRSSSMLR